MDSDIPFTVTIPPSGAVRTLSSLATITTNSAHNLQVGNIVQVQSVTDSSFNGTQTVTAVPTSTTFQYTSSGANVTSGNGIVSPVVQGDWATDTVLLPLANKAYRKVQSRLQENGSKTMSSEIYTTLAANATQYSDTTNPSLPADFLAPRDLSERISGSGLAYVPMRQVNVIPSFPDGTTLQVNGVYAWFEDGIYLPGSVNAMDIRLRYFVAFPDVSDGTGQFTIRGCQDAIATYTAFLAANSRGSGNASIFLGMFNEDMKELLNLQAHARNYLVGRRRANNVGRGSGRFWGTGRVW
jgi:hypothetical protein